MGGDSPARATKIGSKLCPGHTQGVRKIVRGKNGWHAALALVHAVMRNRFGAMLGHAFAMVEHHGRRLAGERTRLGRFDVSEQGKSQGKKAKERTHPAIQ